MSNNLNEVDEPCQRCPTGRAHRTIGTVAVCHVCANRILNPIRKRVGRQLPIGYAQEIGNGVVRCQWCGATWVGAIDDDCSWCIGRYTRMDDDERNALLWPSWATNGLEGKRFDDLDEVGKAVWKRTRGQHADVDTIDKWLWELSNAVRRGLVTEAQAEQAIARVVRP